MSSEVIIIGLGGGTGSGKTLLAKNLLSRFDNPRLTLIEQDSYYKDLKDLPMAERNNRNYDHPDAFDWELLKQNLRDLSEGRSTKIPVYDYKTHTRFQEYRTIANPRVILLEGILVLLDPGIRKFMHIKAYVEAEADLRFIRRLRRDIRKRGRSVDSVIEQYEQTVRPMHNQFVEPSKQYADIIIPGGGQNNIAIDLLYSKIHYILHP